MPISFEKESIAMQIAQFGMCFNGGGPGSGCFEVGNRDVFSHPVTNNSLAGEDLRLIAAFICSKPMIYMLSFQGCEFVDIGDAFAHLVSPNAHLKYICFSDLYLNDATVASLIYALRLNMPVCVSFSNVTFSSEAAIRQLQSELITHNSLSEFNSVNGIGKVNAAFTPVANSRRSAPWPIEALSGQRPKRSRIQPESM